MPFSGRPSALLTLVEKKAFASTGAQLLWRARRNLLLPVEAELADGSYLSTIYSFAQGASISRKGLRRGESSTMKSPCVEDVSLFGAR